MDCSYLVTDSHYGLSVSMAHTPEPKRVGKKGIRKWGKYKFSANTMNLGIKRIYQSESRRLKMYPVCTPTQWPPNFRVCAFLVNKKLII